MSFHGFITPIIGFPGSRPPPARIPTPGELTGCVSIGGLDLCGSIPLPQLPGLPTPALPGGAPTVPRAPTGPVPMFPVQGCMPGTQAAFLNGRPCCPSGMHFSKKTGCCVKNRRMNVMNMKAHARATRRILGNARAQKRARKAVGEAAREMGACPRPPRKCPKCK